MPELMEDLYSRLLQDVRFEEGLKACMNCGICTGICPAAEYYNYDPRRIVDLVQTRNNDIIRELLKSETIWYCGQCMSCKTRCPRGNTPGMVIMALRKLSQELGYFTASEKGRQQFALKRTVGDNVLKYGYCIVSYDVDPKVHPEQGPVWEHYYNHMDDSLARLGGELNGREGPTRLIPDDVLDELKNIFKVTGGQALFDAIEEASEKKAEEMGMEFKKEGRDFEYYRHVVSADNNCHQNEPEDVRKDVYETGR
ncbi:MAG TPA: 4Fe-4S dicluster domain-containing protein [Bacteroidales bacterium]|jgi:heterodisulfide reductase subunit C|nr:4Fe-4S dicluster domain-containing protein [Bacteroidota bacterium]HOT18110.1 4Fe-4S dicluster domain-containing protein [Bacteroidales bacterium]HQJ13889.1 4Fe-4S dicluster domain-containing protein [Bacteroidales bacterium]